MPRDPPGFVHAPDPTHLAIAAGLGPDDPAAAHLVTAHLVAGAEVGVLGIDLAARHLGPPGRSLSVDP